MLQILPEGAQRDFQVSLVRDALKRNGSCIMRTAGNSMRPFILSGEQVELRQYPFVDLHPGLVVAFTDSDGGLTLHRIRCRVAAGFVTVGDGNVLSDSILLESNYLGVCVGKIRDDGVRESIFNPTLERSAAYGFRLFLPTELLGERPDLAGRRGPLECLPLPEGPLDERRTVGISPLGIDGEEVIVRAVAHGEELDFVYGVALGAGPSPRFSATEIRSTVRLGVFDRTPYAPNHVEVISYLEGLVVGAVAHERH